MSKTFAAALALFATASGQRFEAKEKYTEGIGGYGKTHASTITCPQGYYLEGSRCTVKQEVAEELSCPAGTIESNGQCLDYSAGRYTCPNGLRLIGKICVGQSTADKIRRCPAGSISRGDECVIIGDYLPECPEDSVNENGRCTRIIQKFKQCPEGFTSVGDLCVRRETQEAERHCPSGTIDDGRVCSITTTVEPVCPTGTEDLGYRCATYREEVERCPEGYRRNGSWCQKTDVSQKIIQCANGGNPADKCAEIVPVPMTPVCNVGKMWNGQCAQSRHIPAMYSCPNGYQQQGSSCSKAVSYDCSTTEHDVVCDEPATGKGVHLRELAPKEKYNSAEYNKRHVLPVCHKVPRTVAKTCERTITAQAEAYCAEGTLVAGNRCEIVDYSAPDYECGAQSDSKGECYVTETSEPLRSCPSGYTNSGSSCTTTQTAAPEWSCPRGTEGPNCAVYSEKSCPGSTASGKADSCSATVLKRPNFICAEGFAKVAGKCVKLVFADKVLRCPVDAEERDGLTCAEYLKAKIQDFIERVKAQLICPEGYADNGTTCTRRQVQPADFVCPRDSAPNGSGCAEVIPKISACPKGATLLKDRCWVISTTEPITVDTVVAGKK